MAVPSVDISIFTDGFDLSGSWVSSVGSGNTLVSRTVSGPGLSSSASSGTFAYGLGSGQTYTWTITMVVFRADIGEQVTVTDSASVTTPALPVVDVSVVASGLNVSGSWSSSLPAGNTLVSTTVTGPSLSSSASSGTISYTMSAGVTYTWTITVVAFQANIGATVTVTDTQSLTAAGTPPAAPGVVRIYGTDWNATYVPYVYLNGAWVVTTPYVYNGSAWVACV